MSVINTSKQLWLNLTARLNATGEWLPPLFLRLILFWEFWEAGTQKLNGENWFGTIQSNFPWPFHEIPANISWFMATWGELIGAVLLLLGLFTRFAAFSLIVITAVATAAVHWPAEWGSLAELWQGYAISNKGAGNFKLPLLFLVMLMPLLFRGGGKLSLDYLLAYLSGAQDAFGHTRPDLTAKGLALLALGLPLFFLMPLFGGLLLGLGAALVVLQRFLTPTD